MIISNRLIMSVIIIIMGILEIAQSQLFSQGHLWWVLIVVGILYILDR